MSILSEALSMKASEMRQQEDKMLKTVVYFLTVLGTDYSNIRVCNNRDGSLWNQIEVQVRDVDGWYVIHTQGWRARLDDCSYQWSSYWRRRPAS